jgi:hypothetical protein
MLVVQWLIILRPSTSKTSQAPFSVAGSLAGEAEIQGERGDRIGWAGFASDGQHIYVRPLIEE